MFDVICDVCWSVKEFAKDVIKDFFRPDDHNVSLVEMIDDAWNNIEFVDDDFYQQNGAALQNLENRGEIIVDGQGVILRMNGHDTYYTHEELGRINSALAWHEMTGEPIPPPQRKKEIANPDYLPYDRAEGF